MATINVEAIAHEIDLEFLSSLMPVDSRNIKPIVETYCGNCNNFIPVSLVGVFRNHGGNLAVYQCQCGNGRFFYMEDK